MDLESKVVEEVQDLPNLVISHRQSILAGLHTCSKRQNK